MRQEEIGRAAMNLRHSLPALLMALISLISHTWDPRLFNVSLCSRCGCCSCCQAQRAFWRVTLWTSGHTAQEWCFPLVFQQGRRLSREIALSASVWPLGPKGGFGNPVLSHGLRCGRVWELSGVSLHTCGVWMGPSGVLGPTW